MSYRAIATELGVSEATVRRCVKRVSEAAWLTPRCHTPRRARFECVNTIWFRRMSIAIPKIESTLLMVPGNQLGPCVQTDLDARSQLAGTDRFHASSFSKVGFCSSRVLSAAKQQPVRDR